ncbi:MAG: CHAD domain-containing protein [Gemmatimonadales bacterium]
MSFGSDSSISPSTLDLPASTGARVLVLRAVAIMRDCRQAYLKEPDVETLHDLRVSIRRLRSLVRCYRPYLRAPQLRRIMRGVDRVARLTNAARDLDVQLAWIDGHADSFTESEAVGLQWFRERQEAVARIGGRRNRKKIKALLPQLERRIERVLGEYRVDVDPVHPTTEPTLREEFHRLVAMLADELLEHLDAVTARSKYEEAHQARIVGKRLRYLILPLRGELTDAKPILLQLTELQDVLGDLNDAQILGEEVALAFEDSSAERARRQLEHGMSGNGPPPDADVAPGLIALARHQHLRKAARFDELETHWLHGQARSRLATAGALTDTHDAPLPREIERKYLLKSLPPEAVEAPSVEMSQGYLPGDAIVERIRETKGPDGERHVRTIKLGRGVSRIEIEEEMSVELFEAMWPLTEGQRVRKRRYRLADGDLTWEIDQFLDRELVLAEVELASVGTPILPGWLVPHVIREVTDEAAFTNANLAR